MILFNNDYDRGAHPNVLAALTAANEDSHPGYGHDTWCARARELISAHLGGVAAEIHFLVGGTQVNSTLIAAALRPWQSVLSADSGHIAVHETGAVEATGHKVEALPTSNGKLAATQIEDAATRWARSTVPEHVTQPRVVYISFPTEFGTLYSLSELTEISEACRRHKLFLMIDGARLGYGLGSSANDVTIADIARLSDVFTIGGTKCGLLFGEAAVIINPVIANGFRSMMKRSGALLAKGWLLGIQFATIFTDDLYFRITARADEQAQRIKQIFNSHGIASHMDSPTNQQFIVVTTAQMEALGSHFGFEYWEALGDDRHCVRFCASWSTTDSQIDHLAEVIAAL